MLNNILVLAGLSKVANHRLYPANTSTVYSYCESRGPITDWPEVVFFGLQYYLKTYLTGQVVTKEKIDEAEKLLPNCFNRKGWEYIADKHKGHLPVVIHAVAEGTIVPRNNILMSVENTDPQCYWLVSWLEDLLTQCWYPSTVATQSREIKYRILNELKKAGDDTSLVDFLIHDFGFGGTSSVESAAIGGMAHLVSFNASNNMPALALAHSIYACETPAYIPAMLDNNTVLPWGRVTEVNAYLQALSEFNEGALVLLTDCYNIHEVIKILSKELKEQIEVRKGMILVRTSAGKAKESIYKLLNHLAREFGYTKNKDNLKRLTPNAGILRVEGMSYLDIIDLQDYLRSQKWSLNNVILGCTGLLQKVHQDKLKMHFTTAFVQTNDNKKRVYQEPKGDSAKRTKPGRLKLIFDNGLTTVPEVKVGENLLLEVFRDGKLLVETNMEEVRELAFT